MTNRSQLAFLALLFLILLAVPFMGSRYLTELTVQVMIFSLLALSLNILVGHIGLVSFGHAAFFAIGGYATAFFLSRWQLPLGIAMPMAVLLASIFALMIGALCVRLKAIYFAMLTLAFSMLVWGIIIKWKPVTGGDDGFVGIALPQFLSSPQNFYWFTLAVVSISTALMWVLSKSTMGQIFVAIRENETRANFLGVNVRQMQLIGFVLAALFAAVAGSLMSMYLRGMYPQSAFWTQSGHIVISVLLGGVHSFVGPILGASLLYLLEVTIHQYTQYWPLVMGLILIIVVLVLPEGLIGLFRKLYTSVRRE
ncbi:branched-chain amino acid ABC transporter permease [Paracoccus alkenifer]|uniref:Branched-chain amino acid transport system permease protein n=1 Tax=Paracoccus alkenifer TaxID=65735 RepID=A0A1H6NDL7_9RHOB|nr:branched-chain amino acid ABC transporter permease [Paracoccus alkenifer]SEI13239.1 branched-chain amino acid transport system permease protein [Paracoccus alkenifer]